MDRKFLAALALLTASVSCLNGCKKETPQKTEVSQTEPAAQPASAAEPATPSEEQTGEALFIKNCAACHPDGGNIIKPEMNLSSKSLQAHNITKPEDIVKIMRNPKPGMTTFNETILPNKEATEIAEYVLKTF
ncbi:MAG: c-type cytochrome [Geobacteraceae bacterium]